MKPSTRRFGRLLVAAAGAWAVAPGASPTLAQRAAPFAAGAPIAEAPAPVRFADAIADAHEIILRLMTESGIPGVTVAVGVDGEIVWSEGYGFADLENRVPVTPLTRFRVGSISKPMAAAGLAKLLEQGRVDLDAPVQRYVPSFPEKRWPITTRQLAGHLSGIRHYRYDNDAFPGGNEFHSRHRYATVFESLDIFMDDDLLFEPGTQYSYSSYAWNLLSAVVEGAAGQEFLPFMHEHVFGSLGMRSTVADHADSIIAFRTRFYERDDCEPDYCGTATGTGAVLNGPYVDNSNKWAGGGFLSTPEDLVRFGFAHMAGSGFLRDETLTLLHTSMRTHDGRETGYGIGWNIGTDSVNGQRTVGHGGGSVGGTSRLIIYPEARVVLAIQANLTGAPLRDVPERLARLFVAAAEAERQAGP